MKAGRALRCLTGHADEISALALSPDAAFAVSGARDRTVKIWHLPSGTCLRTIAGHADWVTGLCLAPDRSFVLSAGTDGFIQKWGLEWQEWQEKTCGLNTNKRE